MLCPVTGSGLVSKSSARGRMKAVSDRAGGELRKKEPAELPSGYPPPVPVTGLTLSPCHLPTVSGSVTTILLLYHPPIPKTEFRLAALPSFNK